MSKITFHALNKTVDSIQIEHLSNW